MMVIVPESLDHAINEKIDTAIAEHPPIADERERLYSELLSVFDEHGHLNVTIVPKEMK